MSQVELTEEAPFRWGESLEDASEQAKHERRLVLLDFFSPT